MGQMDMEELKAVGVQGIPTSACRPMSFGACPAHPGDHSSWPEVPGRNSPIRFSAEQLHTEHFIQGSSLPSGACSPPSYLAGSAPGTSQPHTYSPTSTAWMLNGADAKLLVQLISQLHILILVAGVPIGGVIASLALADKQMRSPVDLRVEKHISGKPLRHFGTEAFRLGLDVPPSSTLHRWT